MIETPRLVIRSWVAADRPIFAAMGQDAAIMAHFPALLNRAASEALIDRVTAGIAERGYGLWAVARRDTGDFIGFCGFNLVDFPCPVAGEVEIGWRLAGAHWGHGFAFEAAKACLSWARSNSLKRIVSFTVPANTRSWGLMQRLGMQRRADLDFDHPRLPQDSALRRHIVYETSP